MAPKKQPTKNQQIEDLKKEIENLKKENLYLKGDKCDEDELKEYMKKKSYKINDDGFEVIGGHIFKNSRHYNKDSIICDLIDIYKKLDRLTYYDKSEALEDIIYINRPYTDAIKSNMIRKHFDILRAYNSKKICGSDDDSDESN
jgi:hypothetical protein